MRAVKSDMPKQPVARIIEGKRRKLFNRQALIESGLSEEVLSTLLKGQLHPIHPGTKEHWYDADEVIDAMVAATPGRPPKPKGKTK